MGEVYKARDTRLERKVAVKVLPQHLSASPEVRQRFERKAKTISQLSHPHICAFHDVGREGQSRRLMQSYGSAQYASGWLLSMRETSLMAQPFDARDRLIRPTRPVADDVNFNSGVWRGTFTVSENKSSPISGGFEAMRLGSGVECGLEGVRHPLIGTLTFVLHVAQ